MAVRVRRSLLAPLILVALVGTSSSNPVAAEQARLGIASPAPNRWTTHGPGAGTIPALAVDPAHPSTVYAGAWDYYEPFGTGVYKSTDGGLHWMLSARGLTSTGIYSLAVDPVTTTTVYAGTQSGGIFKTTDGGASWQKASNDLDNTPWVNQVAIDPMTTSTVYVTAFDYYGEYGAAVFKSTDGGLSWIRMMNGFADSAHPVALAID